ncbi:MAG: hypothetical protein FWH18_04800 [Marinilabiliaceae bacterium]|nr:hypothetical protein [Marinilabiliaceae bacterium]
MKQVETAGIIFEANDTENLKQIKELRKYLPDEAQVIVVGYIEGDRKNFSYIGDKVYNYISEVDFDFFMRPKPEIKDFIKRKLDILFVLSNKYFFAIDYISGLSKAAFKIGKSGIYEKNLDFFIETKIKDLDYIILQITNYLSKLNME